MILGFHSVVCDGPFGYWSYERAGRRFVKYMTDGGPVRLLKDGRR